MSPPASNAPAVSRTRNLSEISLRRCVGPVKTARKSAFGRTMQVSARNSFKTGPDEHGHFGRFGGRFVAEPLMPLILELEQASRAARADPSFEAELSSFLEHYVGRPSPLYFAERLTDH